MNSRFFFISLLLGVFASCVVSLSAETTFYTPKEDIDGMTAKSKMVKGLPNVLIIGDSISLGYTKPVIAQLKGIANVQRAKANCGDTRKGLRDLATWLGDTKWNVIHFNWGLWDLCYRMGDSPKRDKVKGKQAIPPEEYEANLEALVTKLEKTGATLIWAATTAVPEGEAGRFVNDAVAYNEVAAKVMQKHGIAIDDLYAFSLTIQDQHKAPGDVHFTKAGYEAFGKQVAGSIKSALTKANTK